MDRDPPDLPPMEVLDGGRPPGALARRLGPLLERRGVKAAAALGVGVLALGGWWVASSDEDPPMAANGDRIPSLDAVEPPAPDETPEGTGPWRISDDIAITYAEEGRLITFQAVNGGSAPRDPRDLQVETSYPGGLASSYAFGCVGGTRTPDGFRPQRGLVEPGDRIFVRCPDTVRLNGAPSRLPPEVINVVHRPRASADRL